MTDVSALFSKLQVRDLTLSNRIVMSPMTRGFSPGGIPTEEVAAYYERRAKDGVGLIVTEGVGVDHPAALDNAAIPVMHGQAALTGWRKVIKAVHRAGGKIFPQLWHMGPMLKASSDRNQEVIPMRPSGIWGSAGEHSIWGLDPDQIRAAQTPVRVMTQKDIDEVIDAYVRAARAAIEVGFDGIAIHAAHGYLPDAFLWSETNQRTDRYGGNIQKRVRFTQELVTGIRETIGPNIPIMLRFSQWKQQNYKARLASNPQELEHILLPISDAGVDIFDASTRRFWLPEFTGSELNLAGWAQKITGKPAMTVGSIGLDTELFEGMQKGGAGISDLSSLMTRFERGEFALVGVGRLMLSNPDFVTKIRNGIPLTPYTSEHTISLL